MAILSANWRFDEGQHPYLVRLKGDFFRLDPFAEYDNDLFNELILSLTYNVSGHNTITDSGQAKMLGTDTQTPISPLFARDLCGRVIYLGYGPERKVMDEWKNDRYVTFPRFCRDITQDHPMMAFIENVFFTHFRTLDMSFDFDAVIANHPETQIVGYYPFANLHPYKLRPDTFYQDGWRLPQTELVYARPAEIGVAEQAAREFDQKWQDRPDQQSYEAFYDACNGDEWYQELFEKGCTIIPTVEACNGYNKLSRDFVLEDYWSGRIVEGLHEIVEEKPHEAPYGTILEVAAPGYVAADKIKQAKVVISSGSEYVSPHVDDPVPLFPNLALPHQRTMAIWGSTWLPTHPGHFEEPSVWGWCDQTGRFLQLSGPLWDPLHYYYASVDKIIQAFKNPKYAGKNYASVPNEMKRRFYPVQVMEGFDTISEDAKKQRERTKILPLTGVVHANTGKEVCDIGYHPLPLQFEYELDNWWFPELDPKARLTQDVPEELEDRLAPVITSTVTPEEYLPTVQADKKATWLMGENMLDISKTPLSDYPFLQRYMYIDLAFEEIEELSPVFLGYVPEDDLQKNVQARWSQSNDSSSRLEALRGGFLDVVYEMVEMGLGIRRFRYELFTKHHQIYLRAWWQGVPIDDLIRELPAELENIPPTQEDAEEQEENVPGASLVSPPTV